ncbi:hypothetical protein CYG49_02955, partial [Candidatus Saccharibacteria bacterium]
DEKRDRETRDKLEQLRSAPLTTQPTRPQVTTPVTPPSLDDIIAQQQQKERANFNAAEVAGEHLEYNPYPNNIHQHVIQPVGKASLDQRSNLPITPAPRVAPAKPVTTAVSPDIMRLATESGNLSISTLAKEAHRLEKKQGDNEVVISLR